jgi:hypothetical protein
MAQHGGKREGAGRKKGEATLIAERTRNRIAQEVEKNLPAILGKAIEQAIEGQKDAREFLFDRGFGKATQFLMTRDEDGEEVPVPILELYVRQDDSNKKNNGTE